MPASRWKNPYFGLVGGWLTVWITIACATDMTLFGYDQGVFSGVVVTHDFLALHDLVGPTRTTVLSTITAIYDVGCFIGAIMAFYFGERLGRRWAIIAGTTIMAVGALIQTTSYSLPQMFIGRVVLGVGNGINTSTAPIWQTETSKPETRGKLVAIELTMTIAGLVLSNWINYGLSFHPGSLAWRFPLAFQFIFIFILWATVPWLPESPRWLLGHGYRDEAAQVVAALEAKEINDPLVVAQLNEIQFSVDYERDHSVKWRELLTNKASEKGDTKTLRRLILGAGTQAMQQLGGINILSYYLPTVLIESVGLSNQMARFLSACNSVSYLIFAGLAVTVIDRWGRRGLMLVSTLGQFVSFLVITILLRFSGDSGTAQGLATASIAFFFLFYAAFGVGMLGVPWLYPTEINSLPMRTKGAALATGTNWITNFVIVEITPIGIQNLGWRFYIVWTVFNAIFIPIIYLFYPETGNRSLEDIDAYYRKDPSLVVIRDASAISTRRGFKHTCTDNTDGCEGSGSRGSSIGRLHAHRIRSRDKT